MKWLLSSLLLALLSLIPLSCTQDTNYTVTAVYDSRILVSQDKETMERMIDCAVTRNCDGLSVMELLPSRKVFFVESGTKVALKGGPFSFSDARKVRILEGQHSGEYAWVYDRMLYPDQSNAPYRLAFASIYRADVK